MFCKKCGNELKKNAKFCSKCGMEVEKASNKSTKSVWIPMLLCIILVTMGAISGAMFVRMYAGKEEAGNKEKNREENYIKMPVQMEVNNVLGKSTWTWEYNESGIPVKLEEKQAREDGDRLYETTYTDSTIIRKAENEDGELIYQWTRAFDEKGRLCESKNYLYSWSVEKNDIYNSKEIYDQNENCIVTMIVKGINEDEIIEKTEYEYDEQNRKTREYDMNTGKTTIVTYENFNEGRFVKAIETRGNWKQYTEYSYYENGKCKSIKDYTNQSDNWYKMSVSEDDKNITYETKEGIEYQIVKKDKDRILINSTETYDGISFTNIRSEGILYFDKDGDILPYNSPKIEINIEYKTFETRDIEKNRKFQKIIMELLNENVTGKLGVQGKGIYYMSENWLKVY